MYYDRETQRKYIRRFILSVAVIIASIVLAVVITNNVNCTVVSMLHSSQILISEELVSVPNIHTNCKRPVLNTTAYELKYPL